MEGRAQGEEECPGRRGGRMSREERMDEKEGKGGMQKAEWDAIIRVDGVRREELAGEQREISPEVERAEGRGQGAKEGKKP